MDEKKTYYIEIASESISQSATDSPWNFKIEANDEEIRQLREYFNQSESTEIGNFIRAHIPFREYHNDPDNDRYDENLKYIYQTIHKLGDAEAKQHIENMGFLDHI
ncbi:hydrolase [Bacillus tuaregi]|uniref:hydrolase n=1 Tax=Bacillus tuaregi TaxID=1816695 RepID=UPI0008F8FDA5|nr:hydrolase [Bacillus tuaregi]